MFDALLAFIFERQRIYDKKLRNRPWPWTNDPILQRAKINNIFRELDAFTQYELSVVESLPAPEQCFFIALARYVFSRPLMEFLREHRYKVTKGELLKFKASVGGGYAYINEVVQFYRPTKGSTEQVILQHLKTATRVSEKFAHEVVLCPSPTKVCELIHYRYPQLGKFRVYEMYTSLTYLKWFPFTENELLVIGPGSRRMAKELKISTLFDFQLMAQQIDRKLKAKHLNFGRTFTVRSLEDSLCEFRKYTIAKDRPVKVYKPSWFPRLVTHPKYVGPSYHFGRQAMFNGVHDQVKRFALVILPSYVGDLLKRLQHRQLYTREEIVADKRIVPHLPALVQLNFFIPKG